MTPAPQWTQWRRRLQDAVAGGVDIGVAMRDIARDISETVTGNGPVRQRWMRAGIDVRAVAMRGRGRCDISNDAPVVLVRKNDDERVQSFTVAHEVGHLILRGLSNDQLGSVGYRQEERLCDDFAGEVLVPGPKLATRLDEESTPAPTDVLRLCGEFGANPTVLLNALARQLPLDRSAYVLARLRGHDKRPAVVDFRLSTAIGPAALFWPPRTRLASLGLIELADAARRAEHGACFQGADLKVVIPRRKVHRPSGDNAAAGPVRWSAARQGRAEPYLLALLDCARLRRTRVAAPGAGGSDRDVEPSREATPR